jgi:hypothetical protein
VNDARPQIAGVVAQLRKAGQQPVDERAALVARGRVDHDPGRFVDDDHRVVDVDHLERHRLLGRQLEMPRRAGHQHPVTGRDPLARLARQAVQANRLDPDQPLPLGARAVRFAAEALQKAVEPVAGGERGHDHQPAVRQVAHDGAQRSARSLSGWRHPRPGPSAR